MRYIEVIVPLPLEANFTYLVPDKWETIVNIGMRVIVPFGKKKLYTAIVSHIHTQKPDVPYTIKEITDLLDTKPILRHPQLKFWEWISNYYMATLGEVYQSAIPAGLKLESESVVIINPEFEAEHPLTDKEQLILDALADTKPTTIKDLILRTNINNILPHLNKLFELRAIALSENVVTRYKSKTESFVKLGAAYEDQTGLKKAFDELSKAKKQLELLMYYLDFSCFLQPTQRTELTKKALLEKSNISSAVLLSLIEKNILEIYKKDVSRLDNKTTHTHAISKLNRHQQHAFDEITQSFQEKSVVLLHGVTSSGKTEVYIHLIQQAVTAGLQVLFLVPEIALTTQLTSRLKKVFGNKLGVYHSKFSDTERVEIWNNVLNDESYDVVIGVRSSIFLPFRKLGLIIVDEEHETSYKQYDPAPRYHARNAAIVLATMHGAKTLLGTATPAIETYTNTQNGKYGLVELNMRHEDMELPVFEIVDTKQAYHRKTMNGNFSDVLLQQIEKALANKEQVILFQNRRGYAPFISCKNCAYVPQCKNCDVSLTVHKAFNTLTCHYCGYTEPIPTLCPACKTPGMENKGFGTEKIEDDLLQIFPTARVSRMDMDTTRSKKSYDKIITDFEEHKVDILIGTQMVTKGLDFERVSMVGILNADNLLNFPDFRSHERAFQLIAQVSGRAGRKHKRGKVILQTAQPEHPVLKQVLQLDYDGLYKTQMHERSEFKYPPFYRMIDIKIRHKDVQVVKKCAFELGNKLREVFNQRILGPVDPPIGRIQNYYIKQLLLKIEIDASPVKAKALLRTITSEVVANQSFKSIRVSFDVDPM